MSSLATDLGTAYVQIVPSAKGIANSIRGTLDPEAVTAGRSAGKKISGSMLKNMESLGDGLTKKITVPAMGAATVIGGIVSKLGFGRLEGMDRARAKLKGLGIEGKQLDIVMQNARDAVTGTTHTLAEGVDVAAGALAAGVKEGAELERYIKLVGDAATGANAPMGEMAQIFNRVQGTGKLMGNELNMIEHRMPGFSQALAKHLGVPVDKMREMVSQGKVTSDDFLDTMEEFAGGMSEAYAETWSGLKDNVLANIGIIGEALLEGLFEDGKKGMAEFLEYLRDPEGLQAWAKETGETIRETAKTIYNSIKTLIEWWNNLSDTTKSVFKTLGGITVVAGPIIKVVTKIFNAFVKVKNVFSRILPRITPLLGGFRKLSSVFTVVRSLATVLAGAIGAISTPVLIVTGVITGLVAAGVALWKNWDEVKEFAGQLWEYLVEGFTFVKDKLVEFFTETIPEAFSNFFEKIKDGYEAIKETIVNFFTETVPEAFNTFIEFVTELPEKVMSFLNKLFIEDIPYAVGYGIGFLISKAKEGFDKTVEFFRELPGKIKEYVTNAIENIKEFAVEMKERAVETGREFLTNVVNYFRELPGRVKNFLTTTIQNVTEWVSRVRKKAIEAGKAFLDKVVEFFKKLPGRIKELLTRAIKHMISFAKEAKDKALEAGKNIFDSIVDTIKELPGRLKELGGEIVRGLIDGIKGRVGSVVSAAKEMAGNFVSGFKDALGISSPSKVMIDLMGDVMDGLGVGLAKNENNVLNQAKDFITDMVDIFDRDFTFGFGVEKSPISRFMNRVSDFVNDPTRHNHNIVAGATGYGDTNVNIHVHEMNVRNEDDINRISRELQRLIDKNKRGRGY